MSDLPTETVAPGRSVGVFYPHTSYFLVFALLGPPISSSIIWVFVYGLIIIDQYPSSLYYNHFSFYVVFIFAGYLIGIIPAVIVGFFSSMILDSEGRVSLKVAIFAAAGVSIAAASIVILRDIFGAGKVITVEMLGFLGNQLVVWFAINEVATVGCWLICQRIYRARQRSSLRADSAMTSQ